jgi:hypothetical protein
MDWKRRTTIFAFASAFVGAFGMVLPAQAESAAAAETLPGFADFLAVLAPEAQKTTRLCVVFDVTGQFVGSNAPPYKRHHVASFSPDLRQYRYDHIDYRSPDHGPRLISSFGRAKDLAGLSGAVAPELLPEIFRGTGVVQLRSGYCYQGPASGSSPDIVYHLLGRTITAIPIVDWVKAVDRAHAELTRPSATQPYFTFRDRRFVLEVEPNGVLKYLVRYTLFGESAAPEIFEELRVLSTAQVGRVTLPSVILRRQTVQEGLLEERYELRRESSREISQAELDEASNPLLPTGVEVVDPLGNHTLLKEPRRVFVEGAGN